MSNLLKLKEWLTVPDAARHLSSVFDEEVSEPDVLRLAIDGRLKLSVNFVNHARGRWGKTVPIAEAETMEIPSPLAEGETVQMILGLNLGNEKILELDNAISTLRGVWDLPMIGAESLDIEHEYQQQTGGPAVTLHNLEGAFVESQDGKLCQLQEHFDQNEYVKNEDLVRPLEHPDNYYPAGGLPRDSVLVVRVESLEELERQLNSAARSGNLKDELQKAANDLADEWKNRGRKKITKRAIAKELNSSDEWCEWQYQTIERIIRVQW